MSGKTWEQAMLWSDSLAIRSLFRLAFPETDDFALTDCAMAILSAARRHARARDHKQIAPEDVLLAMATVEDRRVARVVLERLGVDLSLDWGRILGLVPAEADVPSCDRESFSPQTAQLLAEAKAASSELGHNWVGSEHLVLGLLRCGLCAAGTYLKEKGLTAERFRDEVLTLFAEV